MFSSLLLMPNPHIVVYHSVFSFCSAYCCCFFCAIFYMQIEFSSILIGFLIGYTCVYIRTTRWLYSAPAYYAVCVYNFFLFGSFFFFGNFYCSIYFWFCRVFCWLATCCKLSVYNKIIKVKLISDSQHMQIFKIPFTALRICSGQHIWIFRW